MKLNYEKFLINKIYLILKQCFIKANLIFKFIWNRKYFIFNFKV